ncbi:MAG: alternate gene name: yzbB [uncultured Sulfurovum sp.]|uniref:Alternate gene name: yzbB n=1 Tax=uncultured Sulfurovum sp. TaxID=269237 RepID=A0A6S6SZW8_9BACT|nr:MAG: alternate gene name: yzbB [uncultured Sulfurovum sp.]
MLKKIFPLILIFSFSLLANVMVGAEDKNAYLPQLKSKNVALVVNQSSVIYGEHLVDILLQEKINVRKIFAPEHGFRGKADAGAYIKNGRDSATGLPIISLYGKNKKPSKKSLKNIDVLVFDIQDVGVRFYTYLSTLHYIMEAAAESNIEVIVLDRPNPNAGRIDGEVLNMKYTSFVGMHPVPILYGMTIGEYALMINGEGWLKGHKKANLTVVPLQNYTHATPYSLTIKPSPNLPNDLSIYLYPSLAFFEGTTFSAGRGTVQQFQVYGSPYYGKKNFTFKPVSREGAKYPKHQNKVCYGVDLSGEFIETNAGINLTYLLDAYKHYPYKKKFFLKNRFIDKLAGSNNLRQQVLAGKSAKEIKQSWQKELKVFKVIRENYLLYP